MRNISRFKEAPTHAAAAPINKMGSPWGHKCSAAPATAHWTPRGQGQREDQLSGVGVCLGREITRPRFLRRGGFGVRAWGRRLKPPRSAPGGARGPGAPLETTVVASRGAPGCAHVRASGVGPGVPVRAHPPWAPRTWICGRGEPDDGGEFGKARSERSEAACGLAPGGLRERLALDCEVIP